MSRVYFTADCHFNHANIILYTKRPFFKKEDVIPNTDLWVNDEIKNARCKWMNEEIIKRWNGKVRRGDLVYHIGDFSFKNKEETDKIEAQLNGKIVHIMGNHDYNNGVKSLITEAIMEFCNRVFLVKHHPPITPEEIPDFVDGVLCGHIHSNWKYKVMNGIPIINVGVDVWDFTPVSIESILKFLKHLKRLGEI